MKKIILFVSSLIILVNSFAQTTARPELTKEYYLKKSSHQKTAAWILLIGGGALGVIGISRATHIANDDNVGFTEGFEAAGAWAIVGGTGGTLALCSIPLFISSGKNARRAAAISFGNERITLTRQNLIAVKLQPKLSLRIHL